MYKITPTLTFGTDICHSDAPRAGRPFRKVSRGMLGLKVLIAHDSPELSSMLADVFSDAGACVAEANDAGEAKMLVAWGGYELMVVDLAMGGSGEILDLIRTVAPELLGRTIVLTGDLVGGDSTASDSARYRGCVLQANLMVDLVDLALGVLARDDRRIAA